MRFESEVFGPLVIARRLDTPLDRDVPISVAHDMGVTDLAIYA